MKETYSKKPYSDGYSHIRWGWAVAISDLLVGGLFAAFLLLYIGTEAWIAALGAALMIWFWQFLFTPSRRVMTWIYHLLGWEHWIPW